MTQEKTSTNDETTSVAQNQIIEKLWYARIDDVLGTIAAGEDSHLELAAVTEYMQADYHGRFLIELIQNANDQALEHEAIENAPDGTTVTIVRGHGYVVVGNQGKPFDAAGIRSIASVGRSTKDPSIQIGNKGIGFKSVFQISKEPEIYSAANAGESFLSIDSNAFKISLSVFEDKENLANLKKVATEVLATNPDQKKKLEALGSINPLDNLFKAVCNSAPSRYPVPIATDLLKTRKELIGNLSNNLQTVVFLPFDEDSDTKDLVDNAIEEIFGCHGASILFLDGVECVELVDHINVETAKIVKAKIDKGSVDEEGAEYSVTTLSVFRGTEIKSQTDWAVIGRVYGQHDASEARTINAAAMGLPGHGFDKVDHCPVAVALPLSIPESGRLIENDAECGRICIGLPTKVLSGTRAWVHSHFYGNISRKEIDLEGIQFNKLLFDEAVRLHGALLEKLRSDESLLNRRAVTAAFDFVEGPLWDRFTRDDSLLSEPIVLAHNGSDFLTIENAVVFELNEFELVRDLILRAGADDVLKDLPEEKVGTNLSLVLEALQELSGVRSNPYAKLIEKVDSARSVLEIAAESMRKDAGSNWKIFLVWVLDKYQSHELVRQKILPTGNSSVCASVDKVFIAPIATKSGNADDTDEDGEGGAEDLSLLPTLARSHLNLIDEGVLRVRTGKGRELTKLAAKLAPQQGGLVRRPRLDQLINEALAPCIQSLDTTEVALREGVELLELAARWLSRMNLKSIEEVRLDQLRVPGSSGHGSWEWVPPTSCYFGDGWLDSETEALIIKAYGGRKGGRIIPWDAFVSFAPEYFRDISQARAAFERFGVCAKPRLIVHQKDKRRRAPLLSLSNDYLSLQDNVDCPIPIAEEFWANYLDTCADRSAETRSGQEFDFRSVEWIDGLEHEVSREAVFKLVLRNPEEYDSSLKTTLERKGNDNQDQTNVPALWVHALKYENWPIVPSNNGCKSPSDVWMPEPGHTGKLRQRLGTISIISGFPGTERILKSIGVASLATPDTESILNELGRLATCAGGAPLSAQKNYLAMVQDLFSKLARAIDLDADEQVAELPDLTGRCLPLLQNNCLVPVDLGQKVRAYLNDDNERIRFISDFKSSLVWPIESRGKYRVLSAALQNALGSEAVLLVSEFNVETGFQARHSKRGNLLDWLLESFPSRAVASDIGCLMAYFGGRDTDPEGENFKNNWRKFETTKIEIGSFPPEFQLNAFFDTIEKGIPLLQVDHNLKNYQILAETWRLIGARYQYEWAAYAASLNEGNVDSFFAGKVSESMREDIDAVTGLGLSKSLLPLKAIFLAIRRELLDKTEELERFDELWDKSTIQLPRFIEWMESAVTTELVESSLNYPFETQVIGLVESTGISYDAWQQAREDMGQARFQFQSNLILWHAVRLQIRSILMATAARSPLANLDQLKEFFLDITDEELPENSFWQPESTPEVVGIFVGVALAKFETLPAGRVSDLLTSRLTDLAEIQPDVIEDLAIESVPDRDVRMYSLRNEEQRSEEADNYLHTILSVVELVAPKFDESFNPSDVKEDSRVIQLSSGFWANAFSMLPSVQRVLDKLVPTTFRQLTERRVFVSRGKLTKNEMLKLFPEIDRAELTTTKQRPIDVFNFFGNELDEAQLEEDISLGPMGNIGQLIIGKASSCATELFPLGGDRAIVKLPPKTENRSFPKPKENRSSVNRKVSGYVGLFGEVFIFERLKAARLPEFDESVWVSENRQGYTGDHAGNDSLGFDFEIMDLDGRLSGRAGARCLIEVKSSSGGSDGPFQLTENEWSRAVDAHHDKEREYLIYRVGYATDAKQIDLVDVIRDPYGLRKKGQLELSANDFWVHVGLV